MLPNSEVESKIRNLKYYQVRLSMGNAVPVPKLFNFSYTSGTNSNIVHSYVLNKLPNLIDESPLTKTTM